MWKKPIYLVDLINVVSEKQDTHPCTLSHCQGAAPSLAQSLVVAVQAVVIVIVVVGCCVTIPHAGHCSVITLFHLGTRGTKRSGGQVAMLAEESPDPILATSSR